MPEDGAVWVGELVDRPAVFPFVPGQWAEDHLRAGLRDEVRGAAHGRLVRLWPEEGGELPDRAELFHSRLVDMVERRVHDRVPCLDAQQDRQQVVSGREEERHPYLLRRTPSSAAGSCGMGRHVTKKRYARGRSSPAICAAITSTTPSCSTASSQLISPYRGNWRPSNRSASSQNSFSKASTSAPNIRRQSASKVPA